MKYILPSLPYAYGALEPYIDEKTMRVHHDGHHKTYVEKLNEAMKDYPDLQAPVEELMASLNTLPPELRTRVEQNGGGHANHSLFWTLLTPKAEEGPKGRLEEVLSRTFGNVSTFKERFSELATHHFSNGWAWLCAGLKEDLTLITTKDHESPLTQGRVPFLVLDLWEHAYYLSHQNRREEYVRNFWKVVNWKEVAARWEEFEKTGATNREWRKAG